MDILVRSNKIEITSSMKVYVNEKLGRIEKYFDNADNVKANVMVKVYDRMQKVEITIPLKNFVLRAEEMREDFYSAVDIIIDKLERQIRKNKTKIQSKKIKEDKDFKVKVAPTFRPDKALNIEKPDFAEYINTLSSVSGIKINSLSSI